MTAILFVCLGNICRSPAAEGVLRHFIKQASLEKYVHIESCGLGDWHKGRLPDERMREAALKRGYQLISRAQKIDPSFFDRFDLVLVADQKVLREVYQHAATPEAKAKIHYITHFSSHYRDQEIPDPYYQGEAGFELVLNMIEDSCAGLMAYIKTQHA